MNRARRAAQALVDVLVTVLVYLRVLRLPDDEDRP